MTASSGDWKMVFNSPGRLFFCSMIAPVLFLSGLAHGDDSPLRTYFVGNSVTDTIRYGSLAKLAKSRGHTLTWGRDMIPGAPLSWLWDHPKDGFQQEPFGLYPKALSEYSWDVLSLQPFDRHLDGKDGDLTMARNFIDLALGAVLMSRSTFIHAGLGRTRRRTGRSSSTTKRSGSGSTPVAGTGPKRPEITSRNVVAGLRKAYEGKAKPVLMVPVGDVLLELHERMRVGKVPGFTDIAEVYVDGIHFNNVGSYIVGTTFYATLFREDPRGMTADPYNEKLDPKKDRLIDEKLAAAIQDAVWTVVSKHPLAGVRRVSSREGNHPSSLSPAQSGATTGQQSILGVKAGDEREVSGVKLCWCPPGRFVMGSPPGESERRPDETQVEVTLTRGFWTGKYEVTQGQWKRVVGEFPGKQPTGEGDDFPVVEVNYSEAEGFCRTLTEQARKAGDLPNDWEFRLPTEAQWEYACRAGTTTATAFGGKLSSRQANFQGKSYNRAEQGPSLTRAAQVGSYPANAWGLHDMHGNVYEWCRDWYHRQLPGGDDPDLSAMKGTRNRDVSFSRVAGAALGAMTAGPVGRPSGYGSSRSGGPTTSVSEPSSSRSEKAT